MAVIVHGRRQHIINLYVWPSAAPSDAAPRSLTKNSYNLVEWQRDGMQLWFVSDLGLGELVEFTELFQKIRCTEFVISDSGSVPRFSLFSMPFTKTSSDFCAPATLPSLTKQEIS